MDDASVQSEFEFEDFGLFEEEDLNLDLMTLTFTAHAVQSICRPEKRMLPCSNE